MDAHARRRARQKDRPEGLVFEADDRPITIWAKTWSEVIQACKARLHFFQQRLEYMANSDSGLEHLHRTYAKYLPDDLKRRTVGAEQKVAEPPSDQKP
jgi:hypothetical protein